LKIRSINPNFQPKTEFKFSEAPEITKSMRTALTDLDLEHLWVVYPGQHHYAVEKKMSVWPLRQLPDLATQFTKMGTLVNK
jgi:hypothetical protein